MNKNNCKLRRFIMIKKITLFVLHLQLMFCSDSQKYIQQAEDIKLVIEEIFKINSKQLDEKKIYQALSILIKGNFEKKNQIRNKSSS